MRELLHEDTAKNKILITFSIISNFQRVCFSLVLEWQLDKAIACFWGCCTELKMWDVVRHGSKDWSLHVLCGSRSFNQKTKVLFKNTPLIMCPTLDTFLHACTHWQIMFVSVFVFWKGKIGKFHKIRVALYVYVNCINSSSFQSSDHKKFKLSIFSRNLEQHMPNILEICPTFSIFKSPKQK